MNGFLNALKRENMEECLNCGNILPKSEILDCEGTECCERCVNEILSDVYNAVAEGTVETDLTADQFIQTLEITHLYD